MFAISRNATAMSLPFLTGANLFRVTEIIGDTTANVVTGIGAIGLVGSGVLYLAGRSALRKQEQLDRLQQGMQKDALLPAPDNPVSTASIANYAGPEAHMLEITPTHTSELAQQQPLRMPPSHTHQS